jgi:hypothetical protein
MFDFFPGEVAGTIVVFVTVGAHDLVLTVGVYQRSKAAFAEWVEARFQCDTIHKTGVEGLGTPCAVTGAKNWNDVVFGGSYEAKSFGNG